MYSFLCVWYLCVEFFLRYYLCKSIGHGFSSLSYDGPGHITGRLKLISRDMKEDSITEYIGWWISEKWLKLPMSFSFMYKEIVVEFSLKKKSFQLLTNLSLSHCCPLVIQFFDNVVVKNFFILEWLYINYINGKNTTVFNMVVYFECIYFHITWLN